MNKIHLFSIFNYLILISILCSYLIYSPSVIKAQASDPPICTIFGVSPSSVPRGGSFSVIINKNEHYNGPEENLTFELKAYNADTLVTVIKVDEGGFPKTMTVTSNLEPGTYNLIANIRAGVGYGGCESNGALIVTGTPSTGELCWSPLANSGNNPQCSNVCNDGRRGQYRTEAECLSNYEDDICGGNCVVTPVPPTPGPTVNASGSQCYTNPHLPMVTDGVLTAIGCVPTRPQALVATLIRYISGFAGTIALLLMISGSFQMITSSGNPDSLKSGQERFTAALIGLLFVIFSVTLLEIIGVDILSLPGFR